MKKEKFIHMLKLAYNWGKDNGSQRSDKNFNDFLQTTAAKEALESLNVVK